MALEMVDDPQDQQDYNENNDGGGGGRSGGGGGGRGAGSGRSAAQDFGNSSDSRFKEQSIWTKYTLTF